MKREDIKKVLIIGSGPIVIGQACEFDYSGTQACKALRELGYKIVLVNSNPATIMTDPVMADATYIEPLNVERLSQIIEKERPDALLPNLGGQTGLNMAMELNKAGVLDKYGVQVIGVNLDAIERGEDREIFKETMKGLGIDTPRSGICHTVEGAEKIAEEIGFPLVVRPAYTMGGQGGGFCYNVEELRTIVSNGLDLSMTHQCLIEESILGWEELEVEVVRDAKNQMIAICFIENIDAVGVHTGDSFCSAPFMTIDKELEERLKRDAFKIVESIGVIGGTNVQFAHNPKTGRVVIIEINPRTSRSSALASKATGFPIALISAKLASGIAPVAKFLEKGMNVAIGTDGAASNNSTDMLETMKLAALIQKGIHRDASVITADQVIRMAACGGARAIGMENLVGTLEAGKKADMVLFDPKHLKSFPDHDAEATAVYASSEENIDTTIVNGKIVYHQGSFSGGLSEEEIIRETAAEVRKMPD